MNSVDLIIIVVLALFAISGLGKSLVSEVLDLIGFVGSFILSLRFYNLTGKFLEQFFSLPHSLANVLGFIALWYVVETMFSLVELIFFSVFKKGRIFLGEGILSIIPAFLKGLILISLVLVLIATIPLQPHIKRLVQQSRIGSYILGRTYQLEAPLKNVFGGLANDTLTFLTIEPKTNERVNIGFRTDQFFFDEKMEFAMIDLVNKERMSRRIPPLVFDSSLRAVARSHSADMLKKGYFAHYSPEGKNVADRLTQAGIPYLVVGENLAFAPSLELAHQGLMKSPGHRANVLSEDFHKVGIGIANGGDYGIMFTQVFSN